MVRAMRLTRVHHGLTRARQMVELKNGESFNGHLVNCDNFMNLTLREVVQTAATGDQFWQLKECYIRGSTVRAGFPHQRCKREADYGADQVSARARPATGCREG
jgi:small nuclear ribonucleoprotein (snRNP)-like protein